MIYIDKRMTHNIIILCFLRSLCTIYAYRIMQYTKTLTNLFVENNNKHRYLNKRY